MGEKSTFVDFFSIECRKVYFFETIVPRKYMPIISAVGLFCCNKFEEIPNEKVSDLSKLTKSYFNNRKYFLMYHDEFNATLKISIK